MIRSLVTLLALSSLVACGPSAKEVRVARSAHYVCDVAEVASAVGSAIENLRMGALVNRETGRVVSTKTIFSPAGSKKTYGNDSISEDDLSLELAVDIVRNQGGLALDIKPSVSNANDSTHQPLPAESWPSWVQEKVDELVVDVYDTLEHCAEKPAVATR